MVRFREDGKADPSPKDMLSKPFTKETYAIDEVPVTYEHPPPTDLHEVIPNPGMPRANLAISREKPQGTPGSSTRHTVLQQHVLFWDRDNDGIIWPWDTWTGFRRLGFNVFLSAIGVGGIHTLALFSSPTWLVNPLAPYHISNIHRTKHGSDSEVYDTEGRFVPEKFEEIFTKYDMGNKGGLDENDIALMCKGNRNVADVFGGLASRGEWYFTWLLLKDENGVVSKEKIRGMYDGSIWETVAAEVEERRRSGKRPDGKDRVL